MTRADTIIASAQASARGSMAAEAGILRAEVRGLCNELAQFTDATQHPTKPRPFGLPIEILRTEYRGAPLQVEYQFEPETPSRSTRFDHDPGDAETLIFHRALVNGVWVDAEELIDGDDLERMRDEIRARARLAREDAEEAVYG